MVKDESIDDKLVEVSGSEAISEMYQALKICKQKQNKIDIAKESIMNFMNESQLYESLDFDVKYYYNKKDNSYTFSYQDKKKAGFGK